MSRTPTTIKRIHESINAAFIHKRIVIWYDSDGEWIEEFDNFTESTIKK